MSNETKIYAYCPAGCRYRTVPYDEFINSASIVEQARSGYTYILEKGRTYRLKNYNAATHWGFNVTVSTSWNTGNGVATGMLTVQLPAFDKYAKGVKVSLLDISGVYDSSDRTCSFSAVYEVDGERVTETFADGNYLSNSAPTEDISFNIVATCTTDNETDLKCWLLNEDAEIHFNADGVPEVTEADNGKVLSVVGGKWSATEVESDDVPVFDLVTLGLPQIPHDGSAVYAQTDTADIMAALGKGAVRFTLETETMTINAVMLADENTDNSAGAGYSCVSTQIDGNGEKLVVRVVVGDGIIIAICNVVKELPDVTSSDNGKNLSVVDGKWAAVTPASNLPAVTTSDNGKVLGVVGGAWAATTIKTSAEIPTFDLTITGLATIPMSGEAVDCEMDTTDIRAALDAGATKFIVYVELVGAVELVMNKVSVFDSSYICCSLAEMSGAYKVLTIIVEDTYIMAKIGEINSTTEDEIKTYIDDYIGGVLGGEY